MPKTSRHYREEYDGKRNYHHDDYDGNSKKRRHHDEDEYDGKRNYHHDEMEEYDGKRNYHYDDAMEYDGKKKKKATSSTRKAGKSSTAAGKKKKSTSSIKKTSASIGKKKGGVLGKKKPSVLGKKKASVLGKKKAGVVGKVKRAMSAYAFWYTKKGYPSLKAKNPHLGVTEIAKLASSEWADVDEAHRAPFMKMAEKDKERSARERLALKKARAKSRGYDGITPYIQWANSGERNKVKADHPNMGFVEISKELGRRWQKVKHNYPSKARATSGAKRTKSKSQSKSKSKSKSKSTRSKRSRKDGMDGEEMQEEEREEYGDEE